MPNSARVVVIEDEQSHLDGLADTLDRRGVPCHAADHRLQKPNTESSPSSANNDSAAFNAAEKSSPTPSAYWIKVD